MSQYRSKNKTSQAEAKRISFYLLQQSTFTSVISKLANTPVERAWALLVEDLLHGKESQISQEALGEMVGIGRQCMNEGLAMLKNLGLLTWKRQRIGANAYSLPACYSDYRILSLLGKMLPRFKRICDKLKDRLQSAKQKLSTSAATPLRIRIKNSLSYLQAICKYGTLRGLSFFRFDTNVENGKKSGLESGSNYFRDKQPPNNIKFESKMMKPAGPREDPPRIFNKNITKDEECAKTISLEQLKAERDKTLQVKRDLLRNEAIANAKAKLTPSLIEMYREKKKRSTPGDFVWKYCEEMGI